MKNKKLRKELLFFAFLVLQYYNEYRYSYV